MKDILIIGAGKFGLKAADALRRKNPFAEITIVEKNSKTCCRINNLSFNIVCMDGIDYLVNHLKEYDDTKWIVPSIPVHVAFEWIKIKLSGNYRLEEMDVPGKLAITLPNVFKGENGQIYISNADFICPDNCPEPEEICTYTGRPRPCILYKRLASIQYNGFRSVVIRSSQLSPGVGGYTTDRLFNALSDITASKNMPILLSTACKCHGVMHAFCILKRGDGERAILKV